MQHITNKQLLIPHLGDISIWEFNFSLLFRTTSTANIITNMILGASHLVLFENNGDDSEPEPSQNSETTTESDNSTQAQSQAESEKKDDKKDKSQNNEDAKTEASWSNILLKFIQDVSLRKGIPCYWSLMS